MSTNYFQIQGFALGTTYNMIFEAQDAEGVQDQIENLFADLERSLSVYNPDSIISKFNKGETITVDYYFKTVFSRAKEIYLETQGLFDISAEPIFREWGFSFEKQGNIDSDTITKLLQQIGLDKVKLEGNNIIKDNPLIQLNANAIAKGYATDLVANWLNTRNITNYLVEVGGEIRTRGISPRGGAWIVGVDRPLETNMIPGQDVQVLLSLTDRALATSGNYRQFYIRDGQKISHTINPRTGYPVDHSLLSVTVVTKDAMSADAYATAFLVAGIDKTLELLEKIEDVEVLFICDEDGEFKVHYTAGLDQYILQ